MGIIDTYNIRVEYQRQLDELFPIGAWVTVLSAPDEETKLRPTGVELTTGRVFCSDARQAGADWQFQLFIDPRWTEEFVQEYVMPFTCWINQLDLEGDLFAEAVIIEEQEEDPGFAVIRIAHDPKGPRRPEPGAREFVTELREAELFPRGVQEIQGVEA